MTSIDRVIQTYVAASDYEITHAEAMAITAGMFSDLTSAMMFAFVLWTMGMVGMVASKAVSGGPASTHSSPATPEQEALTEATEFVNKKLSLSIKPSLEIETEPTAEYVAIRIPKQERIIAHPKFLPSDKAGQKTVFLHEVSEIAYEKKGFERPHFRAGEFTNNYWKEAGGKDPRAIHDELIKKGYYYGKGSSFNIEEMLSGEYYGEGTTVSKGLLPEHHSSGSEMKMPEIERYHGIIVAVGGINTKSLSLPDWDVSYVEFPPGQMREYRDALTRARVDIVRVTDRRIYFEQ